MIFTNLERDLVERVVDGSGSGDGSDGYGGYGGSGSRGACARGNTTSDLASVTDAELLAVYHASDALAALRINYTRALAMPHVRWAMARIALRRRQRQAPAAPIQPRLI